MKYMGGVSSDSGSDSLMSQLQQSALYRLGLSHGAIGYVEVLH